MKNVFKKFLFALLFFLSLLALSLAGKSATASALGSGISNAGSSSPSTGFRWEMTVQLSPEEKDAVQQNGSVTIPALQAKSVTAAITDSTLTLSGQENLDQMRAALFNTTSPLADFLDGPAELTLNMPANGTPVTLNLEARATTGYRWEVIGDSNSLYSMASSTIKDRYHAEGAPSIQTFQLQPKGSGSTTVRLIYRRPFGTAEATHAKLSIWMSSVNPVIEISNPNPAAPKADTSTDATSPDPYAELAPQALPASWDWRTQGIVPAIRNQGGCGSCWAFATVGTMESAIKKAGGPMTDLSEQFLVSCNKDGWSCAGGSTADKYHYNTLGINQTQVGAVLESVKPYTATNGSCTVAYAHPYKLANWSYVTGGGYPTVAQIKTAIYNYGPVSIALCAADPNFDNYKSGIYAPPVGTANTYCGGGTDHMVDLVGWNDSTQTWILRNSWGTSWGINGYMNIAYDPNYNTSLVGNGAAWVTVSSFIVPTPISPSGTISVTTPTFTWSRINLATQYQFAVYSGTTLKYSKIVASSACPTSNCTNTPTTVLPTGAYKWEVQAYVGGAWKAYSAFKSFSVSANFNSQFTSDAAGWTPVYGTWTIQNSNYYTTPGISHTFASVKHINNYSTLTYRARMKRNGCTGCSNYLIIRGTPTPIQTSYKTWYEDLRFQYTNDGAYSVWQDHLGGYVMIKDFTSTTAIHQNDWNTLMVVANGSAMKFYINGTLVWSGSVSSTPASGQVGLGGNANATGEQLLVDWATLSTTVSSSLDNSMLEVQPVQGLPGLDNGGMYKP
jgi:C1A family cysteine protease